MRLRRRGLLLPCLETPVRGIEIAHWLLAPGEARVSAADLASATVGARPGCCAFVPESERLAIRPALRHRLARPIAPFAPPQCRNITADAGFSLSPQRWRSSRCGMSTQAAGGSVGDADVVPQPHAADRDPLSRPKDHDQPSDVRADAPPLIVVPGPEPNAKGSASPGALGPQGVESDDAALALLSMAIERPGHSGEIRSRASNSPSPSPGRLEGADRDNDSPMDAEPAPTAAVNTMGQAHGGMIGHHPMYAHPGVVATQPHSPTHLAPPSISRPVTPPSVPYHQYYGTTPPGSGVPSPSLHGQPLLLDPRQHTVAAAGPAYAYAYPQPYAYAYPTSYQTYPYGTPLAFSTAISQQGGGGVSAPISPSVVAVVVPTANGWRPGMPQPPPPLIIPGNHMNGQQNQGTVAGQQLHGMPPPGTTVVYQYAAPGTDATSPNFHYQQQMPVFPVSANLGSWPGQGAANPSATQQHVHALQQAAARQNQAIRQPMGLTLPPPSMIVDSGSSPDTESRTTPSDPSPVSSTLYPDSAHSRAAASDSDEITGRRRRAAVERQMQGHRRQLTAGSAGEATSGGSRLSGSRAIPASITRETRVFQCEICKKVLKSSGHYHRHRREVHEKKRDYGESVPFPI